MESIIDSVAELDFCLLKGDATLLMVLQRRSSLDDTDPHIIAAAIAAYTANNKYRLQRDRSNQKSHDLEIAYGTVQLTSHTRFNPIIDIAVVVLKHLKSTMSSQISKKRKFVADGVFRAELNEFFTRELAEEGYSGCDVRVTHARTEVPYTHSFALDVPVTYIQSRVPMLDHHPRHTHPRSPRREGPPNPRTHRPRPKTLQVSRKLARAVR